MHAPITNAPLRHARARILTCIQTSSGIRPCSIKPRTKLKSVSLAAGYATSISLKPHLSRVSKKIDFWATVIGFARAWFPSRRSVDSQIGGDRFTFEGHWRLGRSSGVYGLYLMDGSALEWRIASRWRSVLTVLDFAPRANSQHRHGCSCYKACGGQEVSGVD